MVDNSHIHDKETVFHDAWARSTDLASIRVKESFEAPTAFENRFILNEMGSLKGKRLLDIGCGLGESSVYFALQGAHVTASDISPEMVATAVKLGQLHGAEIEGIVSTAEGLGVESQSYDFVYLANIIHHVHDRPSLFAQVQRALKPGGRFFSIDPIAYNPLINYYRRIATKVRTEDESPLTQRDIKTARAFFPDVRHREFWMASLALFVKYYIFDRVHPNDDRYWKRILRETDRSLWWWKPLSGADSFLTRVPGLRWLAWNIVMYGTRQK
jgi:2-polyprenyl-3-methyl-5-hydroxy-6-metoxy-1,4-benzoquinol methylase